MPGGQGRGAPSLPGPRELFPVCGRGRRGGAWGSLKNPPGTVGVLCSAARDAAFRGPAQRLLLSSGCLRPELPSAEPLRSGQRLGLQGQPRTRGDLPSPAWATVLVRGWHIPPEPVVTSEGRASVPTSEGASAPHLPNSKPLTEQRGAGLLSLATPFFRGQLCWLWWGLLQVVRGKLCSLGLI